MGLTYEELSKIIHSDGAWLVLLAYAFRSVLDAVLAGIWKGLGLDGHLKTIEEATRDGVEAALKCSCCKDGGKAAVLPAESPADNKPTPEERKRKDEEEEAQIKSLVSPAAAPEREWRAVTTHDATRGMVSWEQALAMSPEATFDAIRRTRRTEQSTMQKCRMRHIERILECGMESTWKIELRINDGVAKFSHTGYPRRSLVIIRRSAGCINPNQSILLATIPVGCTTAFMLWRATKTGHGSTLTLVVKTPSVIRTLEISSHHLPYRKRYISVGTAVYEGSNLSAATENH